MFSIVSRLQALQHTSSVAKARFRGCQIERPDGKERVGRAVHEKIPPRSSPPSKCGAERWGHTELPRFTAWFIADTMNAALLSEELRIPKMFLPTLCRASKTPKSLPLRNAPSLSQLQRSWQRSFTSSSRVAISVAEMNERDIASIKVKQDRLMKDIHDTCEWGKGERWGEYVSQSNR